MYEWDYEQEQKDKYAEHIRSFACTILASNDLSKAAPEVNSMLAFIRGCGYAEETIQTLLMSLNQIKDKSNTEEFVACINKFADGIKIMPLPSKKVASNSISINNSNSQSVNVYIEAIKKGFSEELTSEQIEALKSLIESKKSKGDIKKWLCDLGSNTLSGVLSTIITGLPNPPFGL